MQKHRKVWGFRLNTKHLPRGRHLRAQRVLLSLTKRIALFITTSTAQTHTFSKWTRLPSKQTPMPIPFEKPAQVFQYDRTSYRGKVQIRTLTKAAEIKWRIIIERCMNATQLFKGMLLISGTTRIRWIASQQSLTLASEAEPWASVYSLVSSINIPEMSSNNSSWNDGHFNTSDEHSESSPKIFIPCK